MGPVMLHRDHARAFELIRHLRGVVSGMQIARHHHGVHVKEALEVVNGPDKVTIHARICQVADVLTAQQLILLDKTKRVLEIRPGGQDGQVTGLLQVHGRGHIAPGSTQ